MLNKVCLMGRMCSDPELKRTQNGTAVCSFTLAVARDFRPDNGDRQTDFIDVVAWTKTAEFISRYFSKGQAIVICGRLQTRNWEDKNGNKRKVTEVVADSTYFAGGNRSDGQSGAHGATGEPEFVEIEDGSELPF